jgi:hypothetical protein
LLEAAVWESTFGGGFDGVMFRKLSLSWVPAFVYSSCLLFVELFRF